MKSIFVAGVVLLAVAPQDASASTYRGILCITDVQSCNPGDWIPACYTMSYRDTGSMTALAFGDPNFRYVMYTSLPLGPEYQAVSQRSITTFSYGTDEGVSMRFTTFQLGNKTVKIDGDMKGVDGKQDYPNCTLTFRVNGKMQ